MPAHSHPDLSIIIPFFNEEKTAEANLHRLLDALKSLTCDWEVLLVNDGSIDKGPEKIKGLISEKPQVRLLSYHPNRGRGYALRHGFDNARGKFIITAEFDLGYGTEIFSRLYQALQKTQADLVVASPYMPGGSLKNVPLGRAFLSRFGNMILREAFGRKISTASGMTRGYRGETVQKLQLTENGKEIHLEILTKAFELGLIVTEIPATLSWSQDRRKRTGSAPFKPLPLIRSHLRLSFAQRPLLLIGLATLVLSLIGLSMGLYAALQSLGGIPMGNRPVTLVAILFILFSTQLGCFLFLGFMISQLNRSVIHLQSQIKQIRHQNKD